MLRAGSVRPQHVAANSVGYALDYGPPTSLHGDRVHSVDLQASDSILESTGAAQGNPASADASHGPPLLLRGLLLYAAAILIVGWSYGLWQIRMDRQLTLESSRNQLSITATALANHVLAMIHDGVGAAAAGANEIDSLTGTHPAAEHETSAVLQRMLTGGDYVHALFIATPTRYAVARREPEEHRGGQPAWLPNMFAAPGDTWVGPPLNTRNGDLQALVPIARRVASHQGETTWAGAIFSMASLNAAYEQLPTQYGNVSLTTHSGMLLTRIPIATDANYAGTDVSQTDAFRLYLADRSKGHTGFVLEAPDILTGKPRQYAMHDIGNYPFAAVASRNVDDTLVAWRSRTRDSIITLLVGSLLVLGLTFALRAVLQRRFAALQRSEERYELAVNGSNDGIWDWEIATQRMYYSARFKQHVGYSASDSFAPVPQTFLNLIHPDDRRPTELAVDRHLLHRDPFDVQFRMRTKSGEYRWFQSRGQAIWNRQGEATRMAGSISDIHDRKLAEASLEEARQAELHAREVFSEQLLTAQENERRRIANELHDSVGQNLSLIKNHAAMILQEGAPAATAHQHAAALSTLAAETIADVRAVAHNLRPLHIDEIGVTDALRSLTDRVNESGVLTVQARLENIDDVVRGDVATHLFRITQEALNNVLKHSQATLCQVELQRDIHCVRLTIADNGKGFGAQASTSPTRFMQSSATPPTQTAKTPRARGLGLSSIEERVRILQAQFKIHSIPGAGTELYLEIPIAEVVDETLDTAAEATSR